jgi:outer membrane protein
MLKQQYWLLAGFMIVAGFFAVDVQAQAQPLRIGYTDHEVIIVNMPRYQEVQQQLQQEYNQGQQELQTQATAFQEKVDRYSREQALLSEESRQQREQALIQEQQQLQQQAAEREQALTQRETEMLAPLYESVGAAIEEVAREQNLDLVLRMQVGVQQMILYANEESVVNITLDVARKLGINVEESAAATGGN